MLRPMAEPRYKTTNWKHYNQALVNRGSLTFWIDDSAVESWQCKSHHGKCGRSFQLAVDVDTHESISEDVSLVNVDDSEVL